MNILTNKKTKAAITASIYAVIAFFMVSYVTSVDFSKLSDVQINWLYVFAALPFSILSRVFLPYIWIRLIRVYHPIESSSDYWHLNYIYAKSWLGRYIPGKVAWVGGKIYFALGRGISKTILGITALVEAALQLLTALLLGVVFLFVSGAYSNFSGAYIVFFLAASIVGCIAISPPVFNTMLQAAYKLTKKKDLPEKYRINARSIASISTLYILVHALSGLPIYFLIRALGFDLGLVDVVYVSGAFIFAGAIGTLALVAPSGIGVREGVILLFLAEILPPEIAVVLVVALRVWSIVLDLLYWLLSRLLVTIFGNTKQPDDTTAG